MKQKHNNTKNVGQVRISKS